MDPSVSPIDFFIIALIETFVFYSLLLINANDMKSKYLRITDKFHTEMKLVAFLLEDGCLQPIYIIAKLYLSSKS
jgi:hypothetical protein